MNNSAPFNSPPCISFIVSLLIYSDWFGGNVDVAVDVATAALVANLLFVLFILYYYDY